ncbi:MAG: alkylation response protein AidB-like acyl-CoA dehydrogenase [Halioglobus sp.]|jgi:alkylation response protein AidB-like acyl-CoA dehydrogenase
MIIDYNPEQKALRKKLRNYFTSLIKPEYRDELREAEGGDLYKDLIRQMGKDGWLALGWPTEYGGQGATDTEQLMFFEEALMAGAPIPFVTLNTVGPALIEYGTEEMKQKFLPGIAAGETHFCIGYSEPEAGTDLAALSTSAVLDPDDPDYYIINGTKMFTSAAEAADFVWLAVRTTPDSRHKGVSMIVVDTTLDGFSFSPIHTVGGVRTNMSYYNNIRVHKSMMIGEPNKGWGLIMSQLNHERVGLAAWGIQGWKLYSRALEWARTESTQTHSKGMRPIDEVRIQTNLAEVLARLESMRIMNSRMAWDLDKGHMNPALASALKVVSTEGLVEICRLLMECLGPSSLVRANSSSAVLRGDLEHEYRRCQINTFGGGINELQRGIVANFGLNMPRHR